MGRKSATTADALQGALTRAARQPVTLVATGLSSARQRSVLLQLKPELQRLSRRVGLRCLEITANAPRVPNIRRALEALDGLAHPLRVTLDETTHRENRWDWQRLRLGLRALHFTRLTLTDGSAHPKLSSDHLTMALETTQEQIEPLLARAQGGLCLNTIRCKPSREDRLAPLEVRLINERGRSLVAEDREAQRQLSVSYWHPAWAVGAVRVPQGQTIATAFLPVGGPTARSEHTLTLRGRTLLGEAALVQALRDLAEQDRLHWHPKHGKFIALQNSHPLTALESDALLHLNQVGFFDPLSKVKFIGSTPVRQVIAIQGSRRLSDIRTTRTPQPEALLNSLFFLNFPEEYDSPHSALNQPVTTLMVDGQWLTPPLLQRGTLLIHQTGKAEIRVTGWADVAIECPFLEKPLQPQRRRGERGLPVDVDPEKHDSRRVQIFTPWSVRLTKDGSLRLPKFKPERSRAFVVVGCDIVEEVHTAQVIIPHGGWVLVLPQRLIKDTTPHQPLPAHLRRLTCRWRRKEDQKIIHAIGVGPQLVREGRTLPNDFFERCADRGQPEQFLPRDSGQRGVAPTRFPDDLHTTRAPRSGVGITAKGEILLCVVDGRADMEHSTGLTLGEWAEAMKALGCADALNLDGGGSSALFLPSVGNHRLSPAIARGIVNRPADLEGIDRVLPWPLALWSK